MSAHLASVRRTKKKKEEIDFQFQSVHCWWGEVLFFPRCPRSELRVPWDVPLATCKSVALHFASLLLLILAGTQAAVCWSQGQTLGAAKGPEAGRAEPCSCNYPAAASERL